MVSFSAHIQAWLNEPMMKQLTTKEQMDRVLNQKIQSLSAQFNEETPFGYYLSQQKPSPSRDLLNLGYPRSALLLEEYLSGAPVRLLVVTLEKKHFFMANQLIKILQQYQKKHKEVMNSYLIRYASKPFREVDFPSPLTPSFTEFMNTLLSLDLPKLEQVRLVKLHDLYHKKNKSEQEKRFNTVCHPPCPTPSEENLTKGNTKHWVDPEALKGALEKSQIGVNDNPLTLFHSYLAKQAKRLGYDCCKNQECLDGIKEGNKKFR